MLKLLHHDGRFQKNIEFIFQSLHWCERNDIQNAINMSTKKVRGTDLTAGRLQDKNKYIRLMTNKEIIASFNTIRGSPQYWDTMRRDMLAKIKRYGPYQFFVTLSIGDFHCPELLRIVGREYNKNFT